ncbi:hypothetical protein BGZ63DRAFT_388312 [Mariannaea sp. PMI_226]|nr:hypothetical protein BGZ63DRAFT_388312 [Mariannaea sp. PMI_226]
MVQRLVWLAIHALTQTPITANAFLAQICHLLHWQLALLQLHPQLYTLLMAHGGSDPMSLERNLERARYLAHGESTIFSLACQRLIPYALKVTIPFAFHLGWRD